MAVTPIRSSTQLWIDDNLDFKSKKGINLLPGTNTGDAVEFSQMNTAIGNAVAGVGNSIHIPVADLAASKAVILAERTDKMIMLIETLGLYRFDTQLIAVSNDNTIIRPTDIASDAVAGRWIKISTTITDHDNLSNILGNGTYHLSLAERDKLIGIASGATVNSADAFLLARANHTGTQLAATISDFNAAALLAAPAETQQSIGNLVNAATAKTILVDADMIGVMDSAAGNIWKKFSFANLKTAILATPLLSWTPGAGTIVINDTIQQVLQKLQGNITALTGSIPSVANTIVQRDAQANIFVDNLIEGFISTATASGTTVLTSDSVFNQFFTGTLNQTVTLPAIAVGYQYSITNSGTGNITVQSSGLNTIKVLSGGTSALFTCVTGLGTTAASWNLNYVPKNIFRAALTGLINGSNVTYTISALILPGTEQLFKNGQLLTQGAGLDYTISYGTTTTITMTSAPSSAGFVDTLLINYSV